MYVVVCYQPQEVIRVQDVPLKAQRENGKSAQNRHEWTEADYRGFLDTDQKFSHQTELKLHLEKYNWNVIKK